MTENDPRPAALRVAYVPGVTPGKWARIWAERFPRIPLELVLTDASRAVPALREGAAELGFVRLEAGADLDEPGLHLIPFYEERPVVVAAKGSVLEAADEVTVADLDGEVRHPFDDAIAQTIEVVAANVGVVVVPQSVARLYARKDVITRPLAGVPGWRIGLAWLQEAPEATRPLIDDFIGVVRGRTANSSRGRRDEEAAGEPGGRGSQATTRETRQARPTRRPPGRDPRAGRSRRRPTR